MIKLLKKELIVVGSKSESKDEILHEISDMVSSRCKEISSKAIYSGLIDREELSSTGLGSSLAIPHCTFENIDEFYIGLITTKGIDFDSIDGEPAKLIFFSIGPKSQLNEHMATLTSISKIAMDKELLERIILSKSRDEVFHLLSSDPEDIQEANKTPKKGFFSRLFKS